jgi:hypothetical protein
MPNQIEEPGGGQRENTIHETTLSNTKNNSVSRRFV